jgi:DNA-binding LacI/PurR family transcriptional regulator/signal transduction histidine kinase
VTGTGQAPRRATIGVLFDTLLGGCEEELWITLSQAAKAHDVSLLCFIGNGVVASADALYRMAAEPGVDGVIGVSSSIGVERSREALRRLYERFLPRPVVSIGVAVPGVTSLLIRGGDGIRDLVSHLVEVHGRRDVAFICGPEESQEAAERLAGYREALERHGIPLRPELVTPGDFRRPAAVQAIETLRARGVRFDALVGANDYMTIHAMRELQRHGVRVPDDVALAGFDDIPETVAVTPNLTTARQPLRAVGREAIRTVLQQLQGERAPEQLAFPAELVVRRSCGCPRRSIARAPPRPASSPAPAAEVRPSPASLAEQLDALFPEVREVVRSASWARELLEILAAELRGERGDRLGLLLEDLLSSFDPRRGVTALWREILDAALDLLGPAADGAKETAREVREDALATMASLAEQRQMSFSVLRAAGYQGVIHTYYWNVAVGQDELLQSFQAGLVELGIEGLFVARYADAAQERAALYFRFGGYERLPVDFPLHSFRPGQLPARIAAVDGRRDVMVFTLLPGSGPDGFAVFETVAMRSVPDPSLVHELRRRLSVTGLMTELARHAGELELRVAERTRELQEAQSQLLDAAHHAGMAEIAVGALHNVGNLLNSVSVSAESASEILDRSRLDGLLKANELLRANAHDLGAFFSSDPKGRLLPSYYTKLAAGLMDEWTQVRTSISDLLERTRLIRETIRSLQEYAHNGLDTVLREETDLVAIAELALEVEATHITRRAVQVHRDYDRDAPRPVLPRTKVVHVVVNLVKNAIDSLSLVPEDARQLTVQVRRDGARPQLRVTDTGVGISPENMDKVFTYGFTTKTAGHGFGLHTCANYVRQMGGTLTAESNGAGRGATFTVTFE